MTELLKFVEAVGIPAAIIFVWLWRLEPKLERLIDVAARTQTALVAQQALLAQLVTRLTDSATGRDGP